MNWFPGPSVEEERTEALRRLHVAGVAATPWRHYGLMLRIVFSVLAIVAVAALFGFFSLLSLPKGVIAAGIAIGTAEWMIRRYHFFRTGLESALWLSGTFAFIFGLPSSGKVEAILVFAVAAALSGWRMRNAFFGVVAAVLVIAYVAAKLEDAPLTMAAAAFLAVVAAVVVVRCVWQRPSTDWLFVGIALAMPVTGYLATVALRIFHTMSSNVPVALILAATSLLLLVMGILRRDRALLISGTISIALAVIEIHDFFHFAMETRFIAGGLVVIAIATILARMLRGATSGFVTTPVRSAAYDEAMQIAGIIAVAPHGDHAAASHDAGGPHLSDSAGPTDKSFGGAGAGGGF